MTRQVIDREKLLDALGFEADEAKELVDRPDLDDRLVSFYRAEGAADALKWTFDLVAKLPYEEIR